MNSAPIGLVGLGLLGSAIADRLLASGLRVCGYDLDNDRRRALGSSGGMVADSAAAVVEQCQFVVLCLPTSAASTSVVHSLKSKWSAGQHVIDTTTGDVDEMIALGATLAEQGVGYVDATVAGSSAQMRAGEAVLFVGGDPKHVDACRPLLRAMSARLLTVGVLGNGARFKLVHNLILGLQRAVLAEGLTLARALGFDAASALALLQQTPARSEVMNQKGPKMVVGDFTPQATVAQHLKDVRLILDTARQTGLTLPLSTCHEQLLESVVTAGLGAADNSAIVTAYESLRSPSAAAKRA